MDPAHRAGPGIQPARVGDMSVDRVSRRATWFTVALVLSACTSSSLNGKRTISDVRDELLRYIGDVTKADGFRYHVTDDRGHVMDTAKIIQVVETGGFTAVYHWWDDSTSKFHVALATSDNLLDWTWRDDLAEGASQPTIKAASDSGYVVAWELDAELHVRLSYYPAWANLLAGRVSKVFDAERQLPGCAEGTPSLYSASSTAVDFGLHYYAGCESDRQARGTTDWKSWKGADQPLLNRAVLLQGYMGSIGDRDVIEFRGHQFTFLEGQFVQGDWRTFRVLLYDEQTGAADRIAFSGHASPDLPPEPPSVHVFIHTHKGSSSFTNPTISEVVIHGQRALVVGLFIPSEGARGDEAGQLIFYKIIEHPDDAPSS